MADANEIARENELINQINALRAENAALEAGDSEPEKLSEPDPVKPAAEESAESKSAKQNRNKNSKPKKEKTENPEEEKPAEEV